jgi:hypothetical protein
MAGSGLLFFFIFDFSLVQCIWIMKKKGVEQKARAKANKKAIRTSFLWFRCVLLGVAVFLFPSMAIFLFQPVARQLIESGPGVC